MTAACFSDQMIVAAIKCIPQLVREELDFCKLINEVHIYFLGFMIELECNSITLYVANYNEFTGTAPNYIIQFYC